MLTLLTIFPKKITITMCRICHLKYLKILIIYLVVSNNFNIISCNASKSSYPQVKNFPSNINVSSYSNIPLPSSLLEGSAPSSSETAFRESNLNLNGESYNIVAAPEKLHDPSKEFAGHQASSKQDLLTDQGEPPEEPIKGAIDYVLFPLLFIGVAGPLFVIMYIVMGAMEFKLPPNVQQRSAAAFLAHRKNTYFDLNAVISEGVKPAFGLLYETVSRAINFGDCQERVGCQLGSYSRVINREHSTLYDYFETLLKWYVPRKYKKSLEAYIASARNDNNDCSKFNCFY